MKKILNTVKTVLEVIVIGTLIDAKELSQDIERGR